LNRCEETSAEIRLLRFVVSRRLAHLGFGNLTTFMRERRRL
jgi:hypothetical protein